MRKSGILMHISSLPSEYGIGKMGKSAYDFVDFLVKPELNAGKFFLYLLQATEIHLISHFRFMPETLILLILILSGRKVFLKKAIMLI